MVFDPKMQSDFAFNRPVETPNFMGVVANLFDFGASSVMQSRQSGQRQLTADERFAVDWQDFLNSKPASAQVNGKLAREFVTKYPQHGDKAIQQVRNMGVPVVEDPMVQAVQGGLDKYSSDPRFIAAAGAASTLPEPQREAHMLQVMHKLAQQDAEIAFINQESAKLAAEGTLAKVQWEAIAGNQKDFADNIVSSTLGPIILSIKNGQPFALSPEQQAQLGVRYNNIDLKNFPMVLQDTRNFLAKSFRDQYTKQFGKDGGLPPKELEERVLASVDALIKVTEQFDSPEEIANALQSFTESRIWENASKQGLDGAIWALKNLPADQTLPLRTGELGEKISRFILDSAGNPASPEQIRKNLEAASTAEAEDMSKRIATFGPVNRELFEAQKASLARSGKDLVDWATFNKILAVGSGWMSTEANNDPQFRQDTQDWFMADIQKHAELIRRNLYPGTELSFQNGRYVLIQTTPADETRVGGGSATPRTAIQITQDRLPKGVTVDDLNRKLSGLRTVKGFGQEVVDAVIEMELGAAPPGRILGGAGDDKVKGSAGFDLLTPASLIRTESGGNWKAKNDVEGSGGKGHFGRLQFSQGRLNEAKSAGVMPRGMTPQEFLNNKEVQVAVENWHFKDIQRFAESNDLTKYIGQSIKGVPVTMDGILAVAHLGGKGGLKKFLTSGGSYNPSDAFGTSLLDYLRTHQSSTGGFTPSGEEPAGLNVGALTSAGTVGEAMPSGAPQEPRTAAVERMATPDVERVARGLPEASPEARGATPAGRPPVMSQPLKDLIKRLGSREEDALEFDSINEANAALAGRKIKPGTVVKIGSKIFQVTDESNA
jgi:hypothetical protein